MISKSFKSITTLPKSIRVYSTQGGSPSPQYQPDRSSMGGSKPLPGPGFKLPSNNVLAILGILSLVGIYEWKYASPVKKDN